MQAGLALNIVRRPDRIAVVSAGAADEQLVHLASRMIILVRAQNPHRVDLVRSRGTGNREVHQLIQEQL